MKKRIVLALCSLMIAAGGIGMSSITHEESPVSQELLLEASASAEQEQKIEEVEDVAEVKVCEEGCTLEEGHDGPCKIEEKEEIIEVILKSTSMERDLKVKFVNKKTGKVISGAAFKMKLTDSSGKTKEYSDHDNDGIIWVKDIDGGNYSVEMMELEGYVTASLLKAEVKKKIEYKVVEIVEEVKTESEVVVSQEDAEYGGSDKDESTTETTVQTNTVEFVASSKKEEVKTTDVQKKDEFGQPMYEKQAVDKHGQKVFKELKKDAFGTPMYAKIVSEPASYHADNNKDGKCDRCGVNMPKACTHTDVNNDSKCDTCKEAVSGIHKHTDTATVDCECDGCGAKMHTEGENGLCSKCKALVNEINHTNHTDVETDEDTKCDSCGKELGAPTVSGANLELTTAFGVFIRPFSFLKASDGSGDAGIATVAEVTKIVYDETSAPIYDETSAPVYDTTSAPVYETTTTVTYYGWQTIDGATYYFDKNGNKVTGQQVIEGVSYTFSSEGVRSGTIGIDVSKYQPSVNWTKVKNAGINFVMIRCGYRGYGSGVLVEDPKFASHIQGAKAAGLRVGVYFFSQAINEAEAVEEASMAVALANRYGINMPIAIDSEYAAGGRGRADGLSKADRTKVTKAFCNTVQSAGHSAMIYASKSWLGSHLDMSQLSGYKVWVAHYADKCGYTGTYHIWQNTSKGKVDGISGNVDMNISYI